MMENLPIERNDAANCARCYGAQLLIGIGQKVFVNLPLQYKDARNYDASSVRKMKVCDFLKHGKRCTKGINMQNECVEYPVCGFTSMMMSAMRKRDFTVTHVEIDEMTQIL